MIVIEKKRTEEFSIKGKCILYNWNDSNINYSSKNAFLMALIRFILSWFYKEQYNLEDNLRRMG